MPMLFISAILEYETKIAYVNLAIQQQKKRKRNLPLPLPPIKTVNRITCCMQEEKKEARIAKEYKKHTEKKRTNKRTKRVASLPLSFCLLCSALSGLVMRSSHSHFSQGSLSLSPILPPESPPLCRHGTLTSNRLLVLSLPAQPHNPHPPGRPRRPRSSATLMLILPQCCWWHPTWA